MTKKRQARVVRLLIKAIPWLLIAGFSGWLIWSHSTDLEGSFEARGELGAWTMSPDTCEAGGRLGFHGVTLSDSDRPGRQLRLIAEPNGSQSVIVFEDDDRIVIPLVDCKEGVLRLEQTSTVSVDKVHNMRGSIQIDCAMLRGQATFDHCKPGG